MVEKWVKSSHLLLQICLSLFSMASTIVQCDYPHNCPPQDCLAILRWAILSTYHTWVYHTDIDSDMTILLSVDNEDNHWTEWPTILSKVGKLQCSGNIELVLCAWICPNCRLWCASICDFFKLCIVESFLLLLLEFWVLSPYEFVINNAKNI